MQKPGTDSPTNSEVLLAAGHSSITTCLGNNELWEYFILHPDSALQVRHLEIEDDGEWWDRQDSEEADSEEGYSSPTESLLSDYRDETEISEKFLLEALCLMSNLESLAWERSVPLINQGEEIPGHPEGATYQGDIWTTLRDCTSLKKLKVVDWGRTRRLTEYPRPIYESAFFTLRNLIEVDLRIVYSPFNPKEGMHVDDRDDFDLIPGRVHVERLLDLLRRCPNLESLSLEINDQDFYAFGGNPYTNITSLIAAVFWPNLHTFKLRDIIVDRQKMGDFLFHHRALRQLSATLYTPSDTEDTEALPSLPESPFDLPTFTTPLTLFLPSLETLYSTPQTLRRVLHYVNRPSPLQRLGILEPLDWNADEELEEDENYVHSLDDVWVWDEPDPDQDPDEEQPEPRTPDSPNGSSHPAVPLMKNYLVGIRDLRSVVVRGVTRFMQLSRLVRATPHLESVIFLGDFVDELYNHPSPHTEVLPYLARWPSLS
ncbi:hypothetical protein CPB83DRAFT_881706, partial [Crepidotus variabilis]